MSQEAGEDDFGLTKSYQCPCHEGTKCAMEEPCVGCETYGDWLNAKTEDGLLKKKLIYVILATIAKSTKESAADFAVELADALVEFDNQIAVYGK